jgi:hypothetical protein
MLICMRDLVRLIVWAVVDLFRSRAAIEAEILTLRQQIIVLRRTAPRKQSFGAIDRLVFVGLYRLFPCVLDALAIVRPATVIKWHRAGFRLYCRWKSRPRGGRPPVPLEIRRLIREMSIANPLWGAPRIHGELLKLDFAIGQTSVAEYMAKRRGPPSQGWRASLGGFRSMRGLRNGGESLPLRHRYSTAQKSFKIRHFSNRRKMTVEHHGGAPW